MAWVFKKERNCLDCGILYRPTNGRQKFCGNWKTRTGCSFKHSRQVNEKSVSEFFKRKNISKVQYKRNGNMLKKYNLTEHQYNEMLKQQNGVCAICKQKEIHKLYKFLPVDHNHKTGKIRGLLCSRCNYGIGNFNDNIELLKEAINYLKEND